MSTPPVDPLFVLVERIRRRAAQLLGAEPFAIAPPSREVTAGTEAEGRLARLATLFGLSSLAADVLGCLVAAEYDPYLRGVVRRLQRDAGSPWLELGSVAELLDVEPARVPELAQLVTADGALAKYALVRVMESTDAARVPAVALRLKAAERIARHLVGQEELPERMTCVAEPRATLDETLVAAPLCDGVVARVRDAMERGEGLVIHVTGAAGTGRRHFAEGLAHAASRPLLVVDCALLSYAGAAGAGAAGETLALRLAEVRREARMASALPCLADWDALVPGATPLLDEPGHAPPASSSRPRRLPPALARFLDELEGVVVLTSAEPEPLLDEQAPPVVHVAVPFPSPSQRTAMLEQAIARRGAAVAGDADLYGLSRRYALDPRRIDAASRVAVELARTRAAPDGGVPLLSLADLHEACRQQLRHDLKSLAARVSNNHKWEDLVIPVDVLHGLDEMLAYVRHAKTVYDDWGFAARHSLTQGTSALFSGPPGTGKTMCASVMARALDMELFRVDLSRVVSKWIGETEKNLGKVFDEAQRSNAIILFDEADSLFAKRTDVKSSVDRYANLEVNFLLQRMEGFGGVTILTTNFEDTIDAAFKRRLTFRLRFEKPDAAARAALWSKVFPDACALADDVDMERLGDLYEMSGGHIRNAAVRAAFLAADAGGVVDMYTCMMAAEREARESGLLVKTSLPPRPRQSDASAPGDVEPEPDPPRLPPSRPRLVPVTHPRRTR